MLDKFVLPVLRSVITGCLVFLTTLFVAIIRQEDKPEAISALIGSVCMLLTWLWHLRRSGGFEEPDKTLHFEPRSVQVNVISDNGHQGEFLDLPIDHDRMIDLGLSLAEGASFSHASLAGPGKLLSRSEYEALRDYLLRRGYLRWINPSAHFLGLKTTGKGRALVRGYASMAASDLPQLEGEK